MSRPLDNPRWTVRTRARVLCFSRDYPSGWIVGAHCHARAQLIYATSGVMEIRSGSDLWIVPPQCALWMPAGIDHAMRARGPVSLRTLYFAEAALPAGRPDAPANLAVSALLRELILRILEVQGHRDVDPCDESEPEGRLIAVLLDEVAWVPRSRLRLAMAADPRLARACAVILADPADRRDAVALAALAGLSTRTLARLARQDLGVSFSTWRRQVRVLSTLPALAAGHPVIRVADEAGYATPSAFAAAFHGVLGMTPSCYRAAPSTLTTA